MILLYIIVNFFLSLIITGIICAVIGSLHIINDEKDQKTASYIIFIVVFVMLLIGINTSGPMAHMFKP